MPSDKNEGKGKGKGKGKEEEDGRKEYRAGNSNDCSRHFCLDYNLQIGKGAGMEDVFTTCFRESVHCCGEGRGGEILVEGLSWDRDLCLCCGVERDSRKDDAAVFIFISATPGLQCKGRDFADYISLSSIYRLLLSGNIPFYILRSSS